ncbi:hypothetical protein ABEF91_008576 [Exophiala dermatitidis]
MSAGMTTTLTVKHLNADSTFLLTFNEAHENASTTTFTVLIDPWLTGPSIITAPWFAKTTHRFPSAIQHLSELPREPDVVIISQNKPDHCHRETLLQLPAKTKTIIAAEPGAAITIRGWKHFDPGRVVAVQKYDPRTNNQTHNNIKSRSLSPSLSPSPSPSPSTSVSTSTSTTILRLPIPPLSPQGSPGELTIAFIPAKSYFTGLHNAWGITYQPPVSPSNHNPSNVMSIIYSPHGLPLSDLQPYIQNHLARLPGALPLTILFHSFDHAQNPWYLGGNIMAGVQGGAEIARALMAQCWISAHDEPKVDSGISVKRLRVKRGSMDQAIMSLCQGQTGERLKKNGWVCDVRSLGVGEEITLPLSPDG